MNTRTRIALPSVALLVGALVSACGGSGAPTDASEKEFCEAQRSLMEDLMPDVDVENPEDFEMPSSKEMADSIESWADRIEKVGTPENIPDDARAGFETIVGQARELEASDFDKAQEDDSYDPFEGDLSSEEKKETEAYDDYVNKTCGEPELPELPEAPDSTE